MEGFDHDPSLWHGRESASQLVRRYSRQSSERALGSKSGELGIWQGVIFPCMANILGVLLFLRLPWIVGKAGILHSFLMVLICCCCTFVTTLSLSAVATNGKILGGGSYFLISRSLGPALGAGVGLCFYMANSIGAAMYFMGTVEAWAIAAPDAQILAAGSLNNVRVTAIAILVVALFLVAGGIKHVARLGTLFLLVVLGVIACMYLGCFIGPGSGRSPYWVEVLDSRGRASELELTWSGVSAKYFAENFGPAYGAEQKAFPADDTEHGFVSLMALWFPAVTGIMAGSNRSADLSDPAGTIPKGTLTAQGVTSFVYLSFVLLYGCVAPRATLLDDQFFAASSAWPLKQLVVYGVMASTIGAGLTSLVSGTRLLSAIASDKTLPVLGIFAVQPGSEPRLALVASGVLSACAIAIGNLNAVAPVLTMFFLMCYTCVNLSCTILSVVHDPNWRPGFRFYHWSISLFGAILCVFLMFAISALVAFIAILFCSVVFVYAAYNSHEVKWGDGFQGMKFQLARNILTHMDLQAHTKNWRPQLLVITGASIREDSEAREEVLDIHDPELLHLASQLKGGRGITIIGGVCSSHGVDVFSEGGMFVCQQQRLKVLDGQDAMQSLLRKYHINGFGRVVYTEDFSDGLMCLVQISGLGAFQPNCVLTAWPREWQDLGQAGTDARSHLIRLVQMAVVFQKVMLIAKGFSWPDFSERLTGHTDIWWIVGDGGILLLLPFLLAKHRVWQSCRTRLFVLADKVGDDPAMMLQELETYVHDFRLRIEVHVKVIDPEDGIHSVVSPYSEEEEDSLPAIPSERLSQDQLVPGISDPALAAAVDDLESGLAMARQSSAAGAACGGEVVTLTSGETLGDGIAKWRRQTSPGDDLAAGGFPTIPPGSTAKAAQGWDDMPPEAADACPLPCSPRLRRAKWNQAAPEPARPSGYLHFNAASDPGPHRVRSTSSCAPPDGVRKRRSFMQSGDQLSATEPCSEAELGLARGLNRIIAAESSNADLVVTNLPDMPPGESSFGYFQLVDEMTKGLTRSLLVRGTATEVITAFT